MNSLFKKNNKHTLRSVALMAVILLASAAGAYFLQAKTQNLKNDSVEAEIVPQAEKAVVLESVQASGVENKEESLPPEAPLVQEKPVEIISTPPIMERNKNPLTRLEEAKLHTKPQISTGKYIDISLKYQNMVTFENGIALEAYLISSGKKGMGTPVGTFKIENKTPRAWSKDYGLWMPNWMAILPTGKIGIHELPIWPGGYQEGANHLGTPVSHGCVRLGVGAAKTVYDWAEIGTPVVVHL